MIAPPPETDPHRAPRVPRRTTPASAPLAPASAPLAPAPLPVPAPVAPAPLAASRPDFPPEFQMPAPCRRFEGHQPRQKALQTSASPPRSRLFLHVQKSSPFSYF